MEYATLNNGIKMPMAGIGTFLLTPDEAEASVLSALKCGYRLIDTANAYVNERAVGRAMKKSGLSREEIFLETKLWPSFYEQPDAVEKTLERLGTPYMDLLLIHQPAGNYIAGYKQMEKACKEGKAKAIGLSNFNQAQIQEILDMCEVKPTVLQTEVHPYDAVSGGRSDRKRAGAVEGEILLGKNDRIDVVVVNGDKGAPIGKRVFGAVHQCDKDLIRFENIQRSGGLAVDTEAVEHQLEFRGIGSIDDHHAVVQCAGNTVYRFFGDGDGRPGNADAVGSCHSRASI